jgi:glutathione S-transferase
MKLYYSKGACSLAVRVIINEIGLDCEYEAVNIKTKKTASGEDFLKINPKGYVPVLAITPDRILTENIAIQLYLADTHPKVGLLPALGDFDRYRVVEWLTYISTEIHKNFGPLFNETIDQSLKTNLFLPMLQKKFKFLDHCLENKKFFVNDRFTLPDAYFFVMLTWANHFFSNGLKDYPQLTRYFTALKTRPSIERSLQQEKESEKESDYTS